MATDRVRTTVTDWKTECAKADAVDVEAGNAGVIALENGQPYDRAYEFSNGRRFRDGPKPGSQ